MDLARNQTLGGAEMEHLLVAAATLTQGANDNAASNVAIYESAQVTATIFGAYNSVHAIIGSNGSNQSIAVGADDGGWLYGASNDSATLATRVGAFTDSSDIGVMLANFSAPAEIVDLLNGSEGYFSASAYGPLTSDVAGALQRELGGGHATDIAGSIWDFG
jgi:hypothetical protein